MLLFSKPGDAAIRGFLDAQAALDFTYPAVGATAGTPPNGWVVDHTRVELGAGEQAFSAAKQALRQWQQFQLGWVVPCWPATPIAAGAVVGILAHTLGVWWLNASRIVYVLDDDGPIVRFGFAYGTLPGHVESGEERFLVEWRRDTDKVWYDILAFSRPRHWLAKLGRPYARRMQKRFARQSAAAMIRAARDQRVEDRDNP
jgi:uncharacterized protein (UPF0548 family)